MGRAPCCDKANVKRGPWSPEEDLILKDYLQKNGCSGNWISLPQKAGLKRCGKSCRLRWLNYLRPDIKHGGYSEEEDRIICSLYKRIGSRWSVIAGHLPGRTDNDVKNYWNTKLKKKLMAVTSAGATETTASTSSSTPCNPLPPSPFTATTSTTATATASAAAPLDAHRPPLPPRGCTTDIPGATLRVTDDHVQHFVLCPTPSSLVVPMHVNGPFPTAGGPGMVELGGDMLFGDVNWTGVDMHSYCSVGYPELVDYDMHGCSASGSTNSSSPASACDLSSFTSLLSHVSGAAVGETNQQGLCGSLSYPSY